MILSIGNSLGVISLIQEVFLCNKLIGVLMIRDEFPSPMRSLQKIYVVMVDGQSSHCRTELAGEAHSLLKT